MSCEVFGIRGSFGCFRGPACENSGRVQLFRPSTVWPAGLLGRIRWVESRRGISTHTRIWILQHSCAQPPLCQPLHSFALNCSSAREQTSAWCMRCVVVLCLLSGLCVVLSQALYLKPSDTKVSSFLTPSLLVPILLTSSFLVSGLKFYKHSPCLALQVGGQCGICGVLQGYILDQHSPNSPLPECHL